MNDLYKTISKPSEGIYKAKGSRFIAKAYPVESTDQVKEILTQLRKEYHDARHHCYAYRIGAGGLTFRVNDDGEPANTGGKPILGQIQSHDLTNVLIVVIRYFGGILLGAGGLIQAYRSAALDSLTNAEIVTQTFQKKITIRFLYPSMNQIMGLIKEHKAQITSQNLDLQCVLAVSVRAGFADRFLKELNQLEKVEVISNEM